MCGNNNNYNGVYDVIIEVSLPPPTVANAMTWKTSFKQLGFSNCTVLLHLVCNT